jgi:GT2 family glycosyltransferase
MISIIFCSIDPFRTESIERHYRLLLGNESHEIIAIRDARSLAEGYNRGLKQAVGEIVIFSHDDIEFLDPAAWLLRLKAHLDLFDLVGLAGTTRLISGAWSRAGPPYTFGQVGELDGHVAPFRVLICAVPAPIVSGIQALDGLFLAARRSVVERVRFDEEMFDGFHCYDVDFSFSAYLAGFRVAVAADLPVLHASQGNFDQKWEHYAKRFTQKHSTQFSPFRPRPYQHAVVYVQTKEDILEIMNAPQVQWSLQSKAQ